MRRWYTEVGTKWLRKRIRPWAARLGEESVTVKVRDLGFRWGSARPHPGPQHINIHWATLQLPPSLIDYVLVHELAHLREANHTPEFWSTVERLMSNYQTPQDHPRRARQAHLAWRRPLTVRAGQRGRQVFGSARRPRNGCRSKSIRPLPAAGRDRAPDHAGVSARDARSGSEGGGDVGHDPPRQPGSVAGHWAMGVERNQRQGRAPTAKLSTASCTGTSRTRIRVRRLPCRATRADLAWLRVGEHRKCQLWPGTSVDLERDALAGTRDSATLGPSRV